MSETNPQPYWAAPAVPSAPQGWTPPPKPGLIPLRPLSFGAIFGAPYQMLRRNPKATFGSALIIQGVVAIATVATMVPLFYWLFSRINGATQDTVDEILAGSVGISILLGLALLVVSVLAAALLQGVIVLEAARQTLGEKLSLGALWRLAGSRLLPLCGWLVLLSVAGGAGMGVVIFGTIGIVAIGGAFIGIGIAFAVLGAIGLAVLWVWLSTQTIFTPCAIVLERRGVFASIGRSWRLVRGSFWKTFGITALVAVVVGVASQVIATPIVLLLGLATAVLAPNGGLDPVMVAVVTNVVSLVVSLIVGSVGAVIQSGTLAMLYIDRRMRTEALDLDLQRAVEEREAGRQYSDPYLRAA